MSDVRTNSTVRLDAHLVETGHYATRARARDAILRGCVKLDGKPCSKPGHPVRSRAEIQVDDEVKDYVSRAALKLISALEVTGFDPAGKIALDLGASTGGFCQVLLERGVRKVIAVDVGHDQLADMLKDDKRLVNIEGLNARDLSPEAIGGECPQFITSDLSFISLKLALPPALDLAAPGALGIFLIKPQFEVGRENLGRGGIVRDEALAQQTATNLRTWLETNPGWRATHLVPSPIRGGDGNLEFLLAGMKDG